MGRFYLKNKDQAEPKNSLTSMSASLTPKSKLDMTTLAGPVLGCTKALAPPRLPFEYRS